MATKCKLLVHAGEHGRTNCPVSVVLPWSYNDAPHVSLRDLDAKKPVPAQVAKVKRDAVATWLVSGLKAGETRRFEAVPSHEEPAPKVVIQNDTAASKAEVLIRGALFTAYNYGLEWVRPFLYPVVGPHGTQVTRNWPVVKGIQGETKDHKHHKSIWVAYGECGRSKVDNWAEEEGHGWQRHRRFLELTSGPVFGAITAKIDWTTHAGKKQFEEVRTMRFYALPGDERLFDVQVAFRMSEGPIRFHDTKEGGLISVRVATSMDVRNGGRIENGYGGINEAETWGKNAPWCDYSGMVDGRHVGIAVLDHADNPRYPTGWHVRDYGLMTANCFAWKYYRPDRKIKGDMDFKKGQKTAWQYRLLIHRGDARQGKVQHRFLDYIAPPAVEVK